MGKHSIDYYFRSTWLSIARMYAPLAAEYDLTVTAILVLINIDKENGTPSTHIASKIGLESRSIIRVNKGLIERGYISKNKSKEDNRQVILKLTKTGLQQRSIALKYIKHFQEVVDNAIPLEKIETFIEVSSTINKLIENQKFITTNLTKK